MIILTVHICFCVMLIAEIIKSVSSLKRESKMSEEKTVKISFSVDELKGKSEEEIKKLIDDKLVKEERKSFFDYLMSLGENK